MQILIIDNNIDRDSWGASDLCRMARLIPSATIRVRRAPQDDLPRDARSFDRVIISGSRTAANEEAPWITRLDDFIRNAIGENKPLLGVCYGHQSIARALGGYTLVRKADRGEFGWGKIELLEEGRTSRLFKGMPRTFHTYQSHSDEVSRLPEGFRLLARSEACAIQACEMVDRPVYGVQFHPERALEDGERSLAKKFKENPKADFVNRQHGKKLFDAQVGETLFRNFLTFERQP